MRDFIEDVTLDDVIYRVCGKVESIDDSFTHNFGIERGHHYEVDGLKIVSAYSDYGESLSMLTTKELIYDLTKILEDRFNES